MRRQLALKMSPSPLIRALSLTAAIVAACFAGSIHAATPPSEKLQGVTYRSPSGTTLRVMLDEKNVGAEVSLGELIFPPNSDSGEHTHGAIEIFYVVSGELEHVVNGKSQILKPGMSGYVRPPDKVIHKTGPAGAKVVVVWVPGAEAGKIASRWKKEP
jgi:quercetin dioxygenase-like cupin family protein